LKTATVDVVIGDLLSFRFCFLIFQAENVPANSTLEILSGTNTEKKVQDNLPEKGKLDHIILFFAQKRRSLFDFCFFWL
jgi:hypothetical protein